MAAVTGRASDERILEWVKMRLGGKSGQQIADLFGVSQPQVIQSTNKVRDADIDHAGQSEDVEGGYW